MLFIDKEVADGTCHKRIAIITVLICITIPVFILLLLMAFHFSTMRF